MALPEKISELPLGSPGASDLFPFDETTSGVTKAATPASFPISNATQAALDGKAGVADLAGKQSVCEEKTTDFTAAVHGNYIITGTATVTDPTPEAGHGFTVLVRNGTATIGGTAYAIVGTRVERTYHSGAWANAVWLPIAAPGSAAQVLTSNGASSAPTFQNAAAGGSAYEFTAQSYEGPAVVGILGKFDATTAKTLAEVTVISDTLPVGSNLICELRKNSTSSGNILSSTLQVTTTESATNGRYVGTPVTSFTSAAIADGDVLYATLTGVGSTTPAVNPRLILRFSA
jgi:hypothetical protein